jgi:hypothetical protein
MSAVRRGESERSAAARADDRSLGGQSRGRRQQHGTARQSVWGLRVTAVVCVSSSTAARHSGVVDKLHSVSALRVDQARLSGAGL